MTREQVELLPLIKSFSKDFGLVGGTAIALHIGHRRSIDFDLFSHSTFGNISVKNKISKFHPIERVFVNKLGEFTISIRGVKLTFFNFPYRLQYHDKLDDVIKMPDLLTLATMKAFALGMRSKWKDYVDLYFIMNGYIGIGKIVEEAKKIFGAEFNEKIFRAQLAYFKDIDYSEEVIYMKGFERSDKDIKSTLTEFSLQ